MVPWVGNDIDLIERDAEEKEEEEKAVILAAAASWRSPLALVNGSIDRFHPLSSARGVKWQGKSTQQTPRFSSFLPSFPPPPPPLPANAPILHSGAMSCDEILLPFCCFAQRKLKLGGDDDDDDVRGISISTFNFDTVLFTLTQKCSDLLSRLSCHRLTA